MLYIIIDDEDEVFKPCTYPGVEKGYYDISNYGRAWTNVYNRFLSPWIHQKGYVKYMIKFEKDRKSKLTFAHRLVAWEFCEGWSKEKREVNHLDGIRTHNFYKNLQWVTTKENVRHSFISGNRKNKQGEEHYRAKFNSRLVWYIKTCLNMGWNKYQIVWSLGYNYPSENYSLSNLITDINKRVSWKHVEGSTTIPEGFNIKEIISLIPDTQD